MGDPPSVVLRITDTPDDEQAASSITLISHLSNEQRFLFKFFSLFLAGVDVTANQDEISDHETFQLEFDVTTGRWYIRTMGDHYWTLESSGGIQASSGKK